MKKHIIIILVLISTNILAQEKEFKFGLKAFPGLGWSRTDPSSFVDGNNITYTYSANGAQFRGGFGVFGDYYYNDNVAINFGLNYLFNGSGYSVKASDASISTNQGDRAYSIQYLQLPVSLKLISNEVVDNVKLFVSPGFALDVITGANVNSKSTYQDKPGDPVKRYTSELTLFAVDFITSAGIEYELSNGMKALIGVTYMHGLFDLNSRTNSYLKNGGFQFRNSLLALDFGIKF